jgi:succinate dehydrogenase / fumarate reductase membrane anchor subunit
VIAPFFIFTFGAGLGGSLEEVQAYFSHPCVVLIMALGLLVGLNHFKMEIDEAVEDYVHGIAGKLTLVAVTGLTYVLMAAGLFALLKLAL